MAQRSSVGGLLGCLVCGEVVKHPKNVRTADTKTNPTLVFDEKLPKGYIVVEDNDCVIVRYILLYNDFGARAPSRINVCWVLALLYVAIIAFLYLSRTTYFRQIYGRLGSDF